MEKEQVGTEQKAGKREESEENSEPNKAESQKEKQCWAEKEEEADLTESQSPKKAQSGDWIEGNPDKKRSALESKA